MVRKRSHCICLDVHPVLDAPDVPLAIDSIPLTIADLTFPSVEPLMKSLRRSGSTGSQATIKPTPKQRQAWEMMVLKQKETEREVTPKAERKEFDFTPVEIPAEKEASPSVKWPADSVLINLSDDASYDHVPDVKEYLRLVGFTIMQATFTNLATIDPERRFDISALNGDDLVQVGREALANAQRRGEGIFATYPKVSDISIPTNPPPWAALLRRNLYSIAEAVRPKFEEKDEAFAPISGRGSLGRKKVRSLQKKRVVSGEDGARWSMGGKLDRDALLRPGEDGPCEPQTNIRVPIPSSLSHLEPGSSEYRRLIATLYRIDSHPAALALRHRTSVLKVLVKRKTLLLDRGFDVSFTFDYRKAYFPRDGEKTEKEDFEVDHDWSEYLENIPIVGDWSQAVEMRCAQKDGRYEAWEKMRRETFSSR
ncbi:hypothetical protein I350_05760 [Cryptococcus amylolentus CBS 6273]|uniref:Uncharacterized protein n=1 Tax=Cryptococcus amylolentus CBS 6273 TaxID=1296118 RepID=A0A1E3JPX4_9TREE|nr:hypothetical protein I350_05760 [Cryptococcus amylolentus CBS 6273]